MKENIASEDVSNEKFEKVLDEVFQKAFATSDDWKEVLKTIIKKYPWLTAQQKKELEALAKGVAFTGLKM